MGKFDAELGSLGVNIDSGLTIDYVKLELIDKAEKGDETSIYKLKNIARHTEDPEIKEYVLGQLSRILPEEFPLRDDGSSEDTTEKDEL